MLILHQYPSIWNLPSLSPFCIKVETYLRINNLAYTVVIENNPRKGPKGKMPVLHDGSTTIPDSSFIVEYLQKKYNLRIDDDLSNEQKARAHALQKMIEENLYFVLLVSRWIDPAGIKSVNQAFRIFFPKYLSYVALRWIRYSLKKQAYHQGIGRHTLKEIYAIGQKDIIAINYFLGNQDFIFANQPHSIDATVYAFLTTILASPFSNPLTQITRSYPNLIQYCQRMHKLFFNHA